MFPESNEIVARKRGSARALDKERLDTGAAWLSTTSTSVISLSHPLPCLFLFVPILLHFPPLPGKSGPRAGVAQAACNLSVMYQHGEGVDQNITKGVSYFERRTVLATFWRRYARVSCTSTA